MNSLTGAGATFGVCTGKVVDFITRNKHCRLCKSAQQLARPATTVISRLQKEP